MAHAPESTAPISEFRKSHPRGLWVLFSSELWERASFYGMRAILTLYMVKFFSFKDEHAAAVYGAYGSLVYGFPILGGWLADRFLGTRRAIILGGTLMAIGHLMMAWEAQFGFFAALGFLCVGNGFFKPNISSTVGKLYAPGDPLRDAGFTIFYMGIQVGAGFAPIVCAALADDERLGWSYGFAFAGVGMIIGLLIFMWGQRHLEGQGLPPDRDALTRPRTLGLSVNHWIWIAAFATVPIASLLVSHPEVKDLIFNALGLGALCLVLGIAMKENPVNRNRMFVFLILWVFQAAFWMLFEQAGSSLTLFTERNVDRTIDSLNDFEIKTGWGQAINPTILILCGAPMTILWTYLAKRGKEPELTVKFALGLIFLGLGYAAIVWGGRSFSEAGLVPYGFLVLMYFGHSLGEMCISPVGLSAVTKLIPKERVSLFMGIWFLTISYGFHFGAKLAKQAKADNLASTESLPIYLNVYWQGAIWIIGAGVLCFLLTPLVKKLTHGVK